MSKNTALKTKRKKPNKKKPSVKPVSPEKQRLTAQMASMNRVFYSVWFLHAGVWNFWKLDIVYNWTGIHTGGLAISDGIYLWLNAAASIVAMWLLFGGWREYKRKPSAEMAIKINGRLIIILSVMVAIFFATFLYGVGVTYKVDQYLLAKAPSIGANISKAASTLFSWAISGVIGNFVYDILKKMFLKKIKVSQEESLKLESGERER